MKKNNVLTVMFLIFAVIGIGLLAGAMILLANLCDTGDPWEVRAQSGMYVAFLILMILGIVFFCTGAVPLIILRIKKQKNKRLLEKGRVLYATVESIDRNRSYNVNGRNPYVIYCTWKDEYADLFYRFKSGNLWTNPALIFPEGSEIEVYVDPNDFRKYYVDAERKLSQKIVDLT
ncbi:MAG: hypothetical protein Q4C58_12045 [Eubacteriales bacterium]|nr:hypothetical protein [Eubacteriales bacterium]